MLPSRYRRKFPVSPIPLWSPSGFPTIEQKVTFCGTNPFSLGNQPAFRKNEPIFTTGNPTPASGIESSAAYQFHLHAFSDFLHV